MNIVNNFEMDKLTAIEEIRQLKARYFRCLDNKDWTGLATCLTDDVSFRYPPGKISLEGKEELIGNFSNRHANTLTSHSGSMPEIKLKTAFEAEGIWSMTDLVVRTDVQGEQETTQGFGRYHETYQCLHDRWLIKSIMLERILVITPQVKILSI
ncbi:nuclear transport factor 2 family protein [Cytophagaceae bacterium YF14B1]|uniref:Nuclear transport factor 2 family protein n=1 Tax=Xanthocytophaga flava TaxID=3048013 RepID=A0AAE3UAS6_9BACT|nr:nuclear transport factor 2 family protein [Xanthocytophaga flavus]MDJ1485027.1 nuclear transport factor 2 family protein [Xanthocytophaga flavus]